MKRDQLMRDREETPVAHAFRRHWSRVLATLVRRLGAERLHLAEDAMQDAMLQALETWRYKGIPDNAEAWLQRVAWRKALDRLARDRTAQRHGEEAAAITFQLQETDLPQVEDSELHMLLLCAHASLSVDQQVTIMLRMVCGLSVAEIASALCTSEAGASQRIVRAKRVIAAEGIGRDADLLTEARVRAVQQAVYLMFTEGYSAHSGESVVRRELCMEALRLAGLLATSTLVCRAESEALCALMCFQVSRLDAREHEGVAVPLHEQDRAMWDRRAISQGFRWLKQCMRGETVSRFHLQAGIASVHASAASPRDTDWACIDRYYAQLRAMGDSPVLRLNHAVAVAFARGIEEGLSMLDDLAESSLGRSHLLPATRAQLHQRAGNTAKAREELARALTLVRTAPEQRLLQARLIATSPESIG